VIPEDRSSISTFEVGIAQFISKGFNIDWFSITIYIGISRSATSGYLYKIINDINLKAIKFQVILKGVLEEPIDNNDNRATIKAKMFYKSCTDIRKYLLIKFPQINCQNFPFPTVKISLFKLSKFPFPNCQNFAFQTAKIILLKLSKFTFSNCQKFSFSNCQNFSFQTVKISLLKLSK
jgi:hypothetical protein